MERFEKYSVCIFCKNLGDIKQFHRNLIFLAGLIEKCGEEIYSKNLFSIIQQHLLQVSTKYSLLRKSALNKKISKDYIYFVKHRNIIHFNDPVLPYSPLKKEEVAEEFQKHLDCVKKSYI